MNTEPALILGAIQALLTLAITFGLHLTAEQIGAILTTSAAVLAVVTRQFVTPTGQKFSMPKPDADKNGGLPIDPK